MTIVVTTVREKTGIDGLACAVAFAELVSGIAVIPKMFDMTVSKTVQSWKMPVRYDLPKEIEGFVVVDVSDSVHMPDFVKEEMVLSVWDHRLYGNQAMWGTKAHIEAVGACATLVYEEFERNGKEPSVLAANLLYTAIISNTLNFKANVSTERDETAAQELRQYTGLPADWIAYYYTEIDTPLLKNVEEALRGDVRPNTYEIDLLQFEVWDGYKLYNSPEFRTRVRNFLNGEIKKPWMLSMLGISEGKTYFIASGKESEVPFEKRFGIVFDKEDKGVIDGFYLRKEYRKLIK